MMRPQRLCSSLFSLPAVIAVLFIVCIVGCGSPDAASLSGTVTFNGEPIPDGSIRLTAQGGIDSQGGASPIVNGSYEIPTSGGLVAGTYKVAINATRPATPEEIAAMKAADDDEEEEDEEGEDESEGGAAAETVIKKQYLPKQYNQTSTLTVDLTTGANTKDFDLEP